MDVVIKQPVLDSRSLMFFEDGEYPFSVCLRCRLCTNDEGCFTAFFFSSSSHRPHQRSDVMSLSGAVIRRSSFSLCVHSGTLCLCVGGEWIIQRSMLQCNAKTHGSEQ